MKALILAGGNGTRLRPLSIGLPKPMVRLLDRPLLSYTLDLLKRTTDIRDICFTLRYLPYSIINYYGDGSDRGLHLSYQIEEEPLGTAGCIKNCSDWIGGDDFLVMSGDGICEIDLQRCIDFHYKNRSELTVVTHRSAVPLEYGSVLSDSSGAITGFLEKPSWDKVVTDNINTGIYIISNSILQRIPDITPCDFAKDVFPKLLGKIRFYSVEAEGRWYDIGSCSAYMDCTHDLLDSTSFDLPELPDTVTVNEPCFISSNAVIGENTVLGPYTVIGSGSRIGKGAHISNSVIDGADIGRLCFVRGTYVGKNACLGERSETEDGCVIGESCLIGSDTHIDPNIKIWPHKCIPSGSRICSDIKQRLTGLPPLFDENGSITGKLGSDLTPETALSLGRAVSGFGSVGLCFCGGEAAQILADAFSCGVRTSADLYLFDSSSSLAAAFVSGCLGLPLTAAVEQFGGTVSIRFYGEHGVPAQPGILRRIETAMLASDYDFSSPGETQKISGTHRLYSAMAPKLCRFSKEANVSLSVSAPRRMGRTLESMLSDSGFTIAAPSEGIPAVSLSNGGQLAIRTEDGNTLDAPKLLCILSYLEWTAGSGRAAVPYDAPEILDKLAATCGGTLLRLGKDSEAEKLYSQQPWMYDPILAVLRIAFGMSELGCTLDALASHIPKFYCSESSYESSKSKAGLLRSLSDSLKDRHPETISGIKISDPRGMAHIYASADGSSIKIAVESFREEFAQELCSEFKEKLNSIDSDDQNSPPK